MAGTAQARLFGAAYEDGYDVPRGGLFNSYLPNARLVSNQAHMERNISFPPYTNMVPQFGQFLDHDISLTPEEGKLVFLYSSPAEEDFVAAAMNVRYKVP